MDYVDGDHRLSNINVSAVVRIALLYIQNIWIGQQYFGVNGAFNPHCE